MTEQRTQSRWNHLPGNIAAWRKVLPASLTSDNPRVLLGNRIAASLLGSYVFCWGLISLGVAGLYAAGLDYHDAEAVSMMIGLIAFLVAFLGSFAASRISQVWGILLGSGVVMILTARFIQNSLVSGS